MGFLRPDTSFLSYLVLEKIWMFTGLYTNFNVQQLYQWEISLCIYILWPSLHVCNYVILNKYWIVQRLVCEKNIPYKNIIAIKDLKFSHNQIKVS